MYHHQKNNTKRTVAIIICIIAVIVSATLFVCIPRNMAYKIIHSAWTARTDLQEKTIFHAEEWGRPYGKDVVPDTLTCDRKYYGEEDCYCSMGEDSIQHCSSCSVYKDWCAYDHWLWPVIQSKSRTDAPEVKLTWPIIKAGDNQRVVMYIVYEVVFQNEEREKKTYRVSSLKELKLYVPNDWWNVKYNHATLFEPIGKLYGEE